MNITDFYKASLDFKNADIPSVTLRICKTLPDNLGLLEQEHLFNVEADILVDVMCKHMPQGVVDRVLARLMDRRTSLLKVPMIDTSRCMKCGARWHNHVKEHLCRMHIDCTGVCEICGGE